VKEIVIDASAIIAVIFNEPERNRLIELTDDCTLVAPASIHWEVGNAISAMFKRRRIDLNGAKKALKIYAQIPIKFLDINLIESVKVAEKENMYAYDAYLLVCAKKQKSPLLSLDKKLTEIAKKNKVRILEV
jgi:predicted nucleic acid-binding protein